MYLQLVIVLFSYYLSWTDGDGIFFIWDWYFAISRNIAIYDSVANNSLKIASKI
jgi:hypothetical protein